MKSIVRLLAFTLVCAGNFSYADATFGGDGCPAGSARIEAAPNGAMTLHLDSYEAQVNINSLERKSCNIAITVDVPAGYSANFGQVHLGGHYDLSAGATAVLSSEAFFSGSAGPQYNATFKGVGAEPIDVNFTPNITWSPCGASTILRLNTSIHLSTSKLGQGSSDIKIDQIVIGAPILKRCPS